MAERLGLKFSETMSGGFALGANDPAAGEKQVAMHCKVTIDDLQAFVRDPQHSGKLAGSVDFTPFGAGIPCDPGIFNLFCAGNSPDVRWMVYEFGFAANGKRYYLSGKKIVRRGEEAQVLQQTTTLYTRLYDGNDISGPVLGAGTLHLGAGSIADMARTIQITNAQNHLQVLQGLAMYLKLFVGELWHTYI